MNTARDPMKREKQRVHDTIVRRISEQLREKHPDWTWGMVAYEAKMRAGERP